jgi:hypothetical protein
MLHHLLNSCPAASAGGHADDWGGDVPHRAGAAGRAADHALRPCLLLSCHRAASGESLLCRMGSLLLGSICLAAEAINQSTCSNSYHHQCCFASGHNAFGLHPQRTMIRPCPLRAVQVAHGGDNFRRTAPCPLCFSQVAARELRLFTARQVVPIKVSPPWLPCAAAPCTVDV